MANSGSLDMIKQRIEVWNQLEKNQMPGLTSDGAGNLIY